MSKWIVIGMLVIMGERWDFEGVIFDGPCGDPRVLSACESRYYQRVYVIGEMVTESDVFKDSVPPGRWGKPVERFTIRVPNSAIKRMTEAEAKKLNEPIAVGSPGATGATSAKKARDNLVFPSGGLRVEPQIRLEQGSDCLVSNGAGVWEPCRLPQNYKSKPKTQEKD